jgi:ectoine hydroxylase
MPAERTVHIVTFVNQVSKFNVALMFISGSSKQGLVEAQHERTTSDALWRAIDALTRRRGQYLAASAASSRPGGPCVLDAANGGRLQASENDAWPWLRLAVYPRPFAARNHIRQIERTGHIARGDFRSVECLGDDCLLRTDPVDLPWQDGLPASALQTSLEAITEAA